MAATREKLIEEKIDNHVDIAVFRVPETSIDDYQFISIELAEDLMKYVGKEVHLVKPSKGLINGFYTNRGTILSVKGLKWNISAISSQLPMLYPVTM